MNAQVGGSTTAGDGWTCQQCGAFVPWMYPHTCYVVGTPPPIPGTPVPSLTPLFPQPGTFQWFVIQPLLERFIVALERIATALEANLPAPVPAPPSAPEPSPSHAGINQCVHGTNTPQPCQICYPNPAGRG